MTLQLSPPGLVCRSIRCPSSLHHACAAGPGDRHRGASRALPQTPAKCGPAAANGPRAFAALPMSETAKSRGSAVPASTSTAGRAPPGARRPARRVRDLADMCIRGPAAACVSSSDHHPCAHGVAGSTALGATGEQVLRHRAVAPAPIRSAISHRTGSPPPPIPRLRPRAHALIVPGLHVAPTRPRKEANS